MDVCNHLSGIRLDTDLSGLHVLGLGLRRDRGSCRHPVRASLSCGPSMARPRIRFRQHHVLPIQKLVFHHSDAGGKRIHLLLDRSGDWKALRKTLAESPCGELAARRPEHVAPSGSTRETWPDGHLLPCSMMGVCSATTLPFTSRARPEKWWLRKLWIFLEPSPRVSI